MAVVLPTSEPTPVYEFYEPTLSDDRTTATLPVGGEWTLGSRAVIEQGCSYLLWRRFPSEFAKRLEEGLTESNEIDDARTTTSWRTPPRAIVWLRD